MQAFKFKGNTYTIENGLWRNKDGLRVCNWMQEILTKSFSIYL